VRAFAEREQVAALELNVSCPNVETGLIMGADPQEVARLLDAVRPLTEKPLIVKLTPNATDVAAVARAAQESGASAVSLINTIRGMAMRPGTAQPWLGGVTAVCPDSGAGDRAGSGERGQRRRADPDHRMGGIQSGVDALDLLRAGATLVAVALRASETPPPELGWPRAGSGECGYGHRQAVRGRNVSTP